MPQLEIADFAPQLVWLVLTFGVLYALMARVALPRIAEVLDSRERRRADDLERAESLKAEAEGALAEFERVQAATQARALAIAAGDQGNPGRPPGRAPQGVGRPAGGALRRVGSGNHQGHGQGHVGPRRSVGRTRPGRDGPANRCGCRQTGSAWRRGRGTQEPGLEHDLTQWNPFDRSYFASWPDALLLAMRHIGEEAQRRRGAKEPGRRWGKSAPRVRCDARPMARHRASRRGPAVGGPENRFAAIREQIAGRLARVNLIGKQVLIPFGQVVL